MALENKKEDNYHILINKNSAKLIYAKTEFIKNSIFSENMSAGYKLPK